MDKVFIRDLRARCIIGVRDWERRRTQEVVINLALWTDLEPAGRSDRLEDSVDYKAVKERVLGLVEASTCQLIEALAERVAEACLKEPKVRKVRVRVEKPGALRFARSAGVEITRRRA